MAGDPLTAVPNAPSGLVTFFFSDIEGSTRLWERDAEAMQSALVSHDSILKEAFELHHGFTFATGGDGFAVAFSEPADAISAAKHAQLALRAAELPAVRMGVHTGEAHERDGDYFGPEVNRAARLMAIGHGGQVLVSRTTSELLDAAALAGIGELRDLGEHGLRDLSRPERVSQLVIEGAPSDFPPLRSLDAVPMNLPIQATRFVGRGDDVIRIALALRQSRLVTLTGVGGVGKTRLALQAAAELSPEFRDGPWLVELAGVTDPAMVAETMRSVLGVKLRSGEAVEDCLSDFLSTRSMLVVLDNCEHVVGAAAELVERLLATTGGTRILATSREGLAVLGEHVVALAPLTVPADDTDASVLASDAVRLFLDRASDARDGFEVAADEVATLARVCRRLDGIPLAIELAAARVRSIALRDILVHLDQRFRLLAGGRRTAPTRQQTLRSAIDWSHDLLDDHERIALRRLSVFTGGFDLTAATAVLADANVPSAEVLDLLDQLVNKSLVAVDVSNERTRYRLLETIADYSWERLEEAGEAHEFALAHACYFAGFSEWAGHELCGRDEARWSDRVELEMENLRRALNWAMEDGNADLALRIVGGLAVTGYRVGAPFGLLAAEAADLPGAVGHPARPMALASAAWTALHLAEYEGAVAFGQAGVDAARDLDNGRDRDWRLSRALAVLAPVAVTSGDRVASLQAAEERREIAATFDDPYEMSQALSMLASLHDDFTIAEEAVQLARLVGNPTMLSYALSVLAVLLLADDAPRANVLLQEAAMIAADVGNSEAESLARQVLGGLLYRLGDHVGAARMSLASAEQLLRAGDRFYAFAELWSVAVALDDLGDIENLRILGGWLVRKGVTEAGLRARRANIVERFTADELASLDPLIERMTEDDVIELARTTIELQAALHSGTETSPDRGAGGALR